MVGTPQKSLLGRVWMVAQSCSIYGKEEPDLSNMEKGKPDLVKSLLERIYSDKNSVQSLHVHITLNKCMLCT